MGYRQRIKVPMHLWIRLYKLLHAWITTVLEDLFREYHHALTMIWWLPTALTIIAGTSNGPCRVLVLYSLAKLSYAWAAALLALASLCCARQKLVFCPQTFVRVTHA